MLAVILLVGIAAADYLERDNPGLREQVESVGGPKGFEDVVASINPIPDDQPDTPAHRASSTSLNATRMVCSYCANTCLAWASAAR